MNWQRLANLSQIGAFVLTVILGYNQYRIWKAHGESYMGDVPGTILTVVLVGGLVLAGWLHLKAAQMSQTSKGAQATPIPVQIPSPTIEDQIRNWLDKYKYFSRPGADPFPVPHPEYDFRVDVFDPQLRPLLILKPKGYDNFKSFTALYVPDHLRTKWMELTHEAKLKLSQDTQLDLHKIGDIQFELQFSLFYMVLGIEMPSGSMLTESDFLERIRRLRAAWETVKLNMERTLQ